MENLARYIIRASFSQERMTYIPEETKVIYQSKDGKEEKVFDALEWLAAMYSHVPNKGEQMVRYYGFYSNVARGQAQKERSGRPDTLYPRTGRIVKGAQEKTGLASSERSMKLIRFAVLSARGK